MVVIHSKYRITSKISCSEHTLIASSAQIFVKAERTFRFEYAGRGDCFCWKLDNGFLPLHAAHVDRYRSCTLLNYRQAFTTLLQVSQKASSLSPLLDIRYSHNDISSRRTPHLRCFREATATLPKSCAGPNQQTRPRVVAFSERTNPSTPRKQNKTQRLRPSVRTSTFIRK